MGYVLKENAVIDVIQAIHKVVEGNAYISLEMSGFLLKKSKITTKGRAIQSATIDACRKGDIKIDSRI
jgi:DNA-binding NarL/FixJ family response regulator